MPTIFLQRACPGVTRWGLCHNLDCPDEETGYVVAYFCGLILNILWSRADATDGRNEENE